LWLQVLLVNVEGEGRLLEGEQDLLEEGQDQNHDLLLGAGGEASRELRVGRRFRLWVVVWSKEN
jgi:hypothetical protein